MLLDVLKRWFFKDAQWWQFWLPQSDLVGGFVAGVIVAGVIALLLLALTGCGPREVI
jgi:hypothetical protein